MNTEPPEGDDLQRLLVSMKQNVLERATPRPKRRRFRPGIAIGVVGLLAIGTATGAVALSLSQHDEPVAAPTRTQQPEPAPSATTPTSAPITATPTPTPRTTPKDMVSAIPKDCRALVPASDYDRLFGDAPLQRVLPVEEGLPADATPPPLPTDQEPNLPATDLYCMWEDPEAARSLAVTAGHGTPSQLDELQRTSYEGWSPTCTDADGIRLCRQTRRVAPDSPDWARTLYVRGDTWVEIDQANFPTDNLLGAIVGEIWGD
ncbi:hypothetical protein GCM10017714_23160 [Curtobacterium pusillum]|uniref:Uncharacterized protein n=1 Tax=Curtobacterium pusillum TaxID=69373 RepID=A0ABX2MHH1_9MICO|nr:hypothetical protein [Curtobacterium pusillum]NUU14886.1 hypothetical protein [Curtobacterium pusillum]GLK32447.1 hypothetical protein GCM10017610_27320 [Curtobacterium pusillum]